MRDGSLVGIALQLSGGLFYLANKVFLAVAERLGSRGRQSASARWRIAAWASYLVGLPPWVALFVSRHDWIAASVEASGAPAMALGLWIACKGSHARPPRWLDRVALMCVPAGFVYSLIDFGGVRTLGQGLEIGLVAGFLIGTYRLAHLRLSGYLWYVLMHICCGGLMAMQGLPWLFLQQAISLVFIVDAYLAQRRRMQQGLNRGAQK